MCANLPVEVVIRRLEIHQQRNGTMEPTEFISRNGFKTAVFECTGDCVFPESLLKAGGVKCANAAAQFLLLAHFPRNEQWK